MAYEYRMAQVPPHIEIEKDTGTEAAGYLQQLVNSQAKGGWEFYRVDSIGVSVPPGCLAALFGARASTMIYYVVTFRREVQVAQSSRIKPIQ